MRVAITGSTGLVGETLISSLERDGHDVARLVRTRDRATGSSIYWSPARQEIDAERLEGVDAVVHLAGEPLGARRWTPEQKQRIASSRIQGTRLLAEALASLQQLPRVLVSGSAVGFYGDRGEEVLTESSSSGDGFLADVCVDWERSADPARDAGIRVVHSRTGVVIAEHGPLMDKVRLPFKLGVGGRIGTGRQFVPWVSLADEARALRFLIDQDTLSGPVNIVSPETATNRELTKALGEVMRRPTVTVIPPFALRILYGEMGVVLATDSQRVVPEALREAGFTWQHPSLVDALRVALG